MSKRRYIPPALGQSTTQDHLAPALEFFQQHGIHHEPVAGKPNLWKGSICSLCVDLQFIHFNAATEIAATTDALTLTVRLPLRAPGFLRPRILECLQAINLSCHHIQWLLDPADGTVLCRQLIDCSEVSMTAERFDTCFCRQVVAVDGMAPAILAILGGAIRPEAAPELVHSAIYSFLNKSPASWQGLQPPDDSTISLN